MPKVYDLIIVGAGIAGLNAARHSARAGMSSLIMEKLLFGGLVTNVNELDGEIQGSGSDLASDLMMQAIDLGAESASLEATSLRRDGELLCLDCDDGPQLARAVIIASGAKLKRLGVPGEAELENRGVSQCADCDGSFHQGSDVVVVGGGDSAVQEAVVLAGYARQVHLVHRGARFSAQQHLIDELQAHSNISTRWNTTIQAVLGDDSVRGVRLRTNQGNAEEDLPCTGIFAYIGLAPDSEFLSDVLERDEQGHLLTDARMCTTMPGVYAAGAVRSGYSGMLKDAAAEGVAAAESAMSGLKT